MRERWSRLWSEPMPDAIRAVGEKIRQAAPSSVVPRVIRRTYARKFFAAVLVAMVVMAGVGSATYTQVQGTLDDQVEQQLTSTAELQADGIEAWVESKRTETKSISSAWQFQLGNEQAASSFLFQRSSALGQQDITAIHYVDYSTGEIRESTASSLEGKTVSEVGLPWDDLSENINPEPDRVYVSSKTFASPIDDEASFVLASKPPENAEAAVLVTVSLPERIAATEQTMTGSQTTLYGASGSPVVSTAENGTITGPTESVTNGTLLDKSGDRVVAYTPVEGVEWTLSTAVPAATAYSVRDSVGGGLLLTILAAIGSLGAVAVFVGRRTTHRLSELTRRAEEMSDGNLDVDLETESIDEFGTLYDSFDEMRGSLKQTLDETEALNTHLETKAEEYRRVMEQCAAGDIACRMDPDSESEAMADIARTYNETMGELGGVIADAQAFSDSVAEASAETSASVADVTETSETVSESMATILDDIVEQDDHLDDVTERMNDFSATIQEVTASASEVADRAAAASERGEYSRDAASDAIAELRAIESATENTVEQVEELESVIEEIESVVGFIDQIASQTHILALNASIEAARAGEAGDGFAVVADEVKDLAEETQEATGKIDSAIDRVREQTDATATDIRQTRTRVGEGSETIEAAMEAIDTIVDDVEETADGIQEIRRATERQAHATTEVVSMVEDVSEISERTSESAQDVTAATEAQTASLDAVSERVDDLSSRASDLRSALDRFDVATGGDAQATDAQSLAPADEVETSLEGHEHATDATDSQSGDTPVQTEQGGSPAQPEPLAKPDGGDGGVDSDT
ncbi:methyl-accepting chemotaxis sensory transducer [Haloferax larsenii]|uniref:Methyl-accepting chemotaxis sensory transducer n=2 Tax=Haloferax larsenii TaxID=302484 RepID=A0A1H7TKF8_HALLR|nr:methyl-accepting chemotaxis sensory transducer [Haloferax larsenii]